MDACDEFHLFPTMLPVAHGFRAPPMAFGRIDVAPLDAPGVR
jgi:hypothetical protein